MEALAIIGFVVGCAALSQVYVLSNRVKELEKPLKQKKQDKMLITRAEILAMIEENRKG